MATRMISNTASKTLLRCEQQYYYRYHLGLRLRRKRLPLYRGGWIHELLGEHFSGRDWKAHHKKLSRDFDKMFDEEKEYYGNLPIDCSRIMSNYLWTYREDPWKVLEVEMDLPPCDVGAGWVFGGRIDLIVEDRDGRVWIVEHKTTSRHGLSIEQRTMDPQTHRYFWALSGRYKPSGVIFNYLRTKPPTIPERLKSGELTRRVGIDTTQRTYLSAIKHYKLNEADYRDFLETLGGREANFCWRHILPRSKNTISVLMRDLQTVIVRIEELDRGRPPLRAIDFRCDTDCDFRDLCMIELRGGDGPAIIKQFFDRREDRHGPKEIEEDGEEEE